MFCIYCGAKLPDQAKFCGNCGAKVPVPDSQNKNAPEDDEPGALISYKEELLELCQQYNQFDDFLDHHFYIYCYPKIPREKVENALTSYAAGSGIQPEAVLILCDDTFFGRADKGFLITENQLISEAGCFTLKDIQEVVKPSFFQDCRILPQNVVISDMPSNEEIDFFCEFFNALLRKKRQSGY